MKKIRVLIIDDSASVRQVLTNVLQQDPQIEVMGVATDPVAAARKIAEEVPDVITLDVEMPRMDGVTFLRRLMAQKPIPVVMCSSLLQAGSETLLQALEAGAVDIIVKPRIGAADHLAEEGQRICEIVKAAAMARVRQRAESRGPNKKLSADAVLPPPVPRAMARTTETIICMGASTGGTESLRTVLERLPAAAPGIVIVQHMPEKFTTSFAKRLNELCQIEVKEAEDGDPILRGRALIAPGNFHTLVQRSGAQYYVSVKMGPPVSRHRPSVDVLFRSAAQAAGSNAVGVIMTGMGDDGARGLEEMKNSGAFTIAQNEETSIVFGMPKEAIARGCVDRVVGLESIAREMLNAANR